MAAGKLYTYPDSFRAHKILIAAECSGTKIDVPPFKLGEDNKTAEFLTKFPLGKVPAFETSDGKCLYESNAIAYYVSDEKLHGTNKDDACLVMQYICFADQELLPAVAAWVFPTLGLMQYQKQATERAMEDIKKYMTMLNNVLLTRTFLVGERVSLADIAVCCTLHMLYKQVLDPAFRAPYGNVNRWFLTLVNQPQFKKVLGEVKLCETMAKFDAKTFATLHPKKDDKKKKEPKQEKPKQEKKKKEKKPANDDDDDDDDDDEPQPKPKKPDPFAKLPPSTFVMDEWKRVYSNQDTETKAIPYFWENFDKEGYSLWFSEYKAEYEADLGMVFMCCNLVGGTFQRLEKLAKNAFASVCIFGEDKNCSIAGIWLFRGQTLGFDLDEDWQIDSPSYNFTKLDPDKPENRKLVNDYFLWNEAMTFKNKAFTQGKIYK